MNGEALGDQELIDIADRMLARLELEYAEAQLGEKKEVECPEYPEEEG
jgi:hypothetical protein